MEDQLSSCGDRALSYEVLLLGIGWKDSPVVVYISQTGRSKLQVFWGGRIAPLVRDTNGLTAQDKNLIPMDQGGKG